MLHDCVSELLCLLSPTPAPVSMLSADLGVTDAQVRLYLQKLTRRGYQTVTSIGPHGESVAIPKTAWGKAERAAMRYWNQTRS